VRRLIIRLIGRRFDATAKASTAVVDGDWVEVETPAAKAGSQGSKTQH